jgi:hypothetical protein
MPSRMSRRTNSVQGRGSNFHDQITATLGSDKGLRVQLRQLEAPDGTPIVDVKPVLDKDTRRR